MVKLFGVLLILGVGIFASVSAVRYEKRRLAVIDGWLDLIFYIRGQIDCYLTPLNEILLSGDRQLLDACMSPHNATDLHAILRASSVYLDGSAKRLLEGFVREIGSTYREEQVRRCDYYMTALRTQREKLSAELPMRLRLSVTICLCIALGTAILLW